MGCAALHDLYVKVGTRAGMRRQVTRIQDQQSDPSMLELDVHFIAQLAATEHLSLNIFMYTIHEMRSKRPSHPLTLAALSQVRMMQDQLDPANQDSM